MADHPGQVDIAWQGWEIETSVGVLGGAVLLVVVGRGSRRGPAHSSDAGEFRAAAARPAAAGRSTPLAGGFAAIAAGDAPEAQRSARRAAALLDDAPLTLALSAQAAQLEGDEATARRLQTEMLGRPETALLGCAGFTPRRSRRATTPRRSTRRAGPAAAPATALGGRGRVGAADPRRALGRGPRYPRRRRAAPNRAARARARHRGAILVELSRAAEARRRGAPRCLAARRRR